MIKTLEFRAAFINNYCARVFVLLACDRSVEIWVDGGPQLTIFMFYVCPSQTFPKTIILYVSSKYLIL